MSSIERIIKAVEESRNGKKLRLLRAGTLVARVYRHITGTVVVELTGDNDSTLVPSVLIDGTSNLAIGITRKGIKLATAYNNHN